MSAVLAAAQAPRKLAVALPPADRGTAAVRRLMHRLVSDPAFELAALLPAPARTPATGPVERFAALERRIVKAPRRQPVPPMPDLSTIPARCDAPVDVAIDLTGGIAQGLPRARHGTWALSSFAARGGLAAALAGASMTEVALLCRPADGGPARLVARAAYDTKFLASLNAEYLREKSVHLLLRELARLRLEGTPADQGAAILPGAASAARLPGYVWRGGAEVGKRLSDRLRERAGGAPGAFGLRIGQGDVPDFDATRARDIPMPTGHFWADPFLIEHGGETWCFFEDYVYERRLGQISAGRVDGGALVDVRPVMTPPHHLSYPFVFHWRGEVLMVPEAHQVGRLEVWRATRFPDEWTLFAAGPEGLPMVDSVFYEADDGGWWLFTHIPGDSFGDFCNELHLFRVDGPGLAWMEPHPLNPVVIGAATARGGGRVLRRSGRLFRLSQDNSGGSYGYGLNVMEITRLDGKGYEERLARKLLPGFAPNQIGTHHADAAGGWFVIDLRFR
jgi:hypothetical protein